MKYYSMCIFLIKILAGQIYAQQGFYLKPVFRQHKVSFARYPVDFTILSATGQNMEFNSIRTKLNGGFDIGLLVGYSFGRMSIETGVLRDGAGEGILFKCIAVNEVDSSFRVTSGSTDYGGSGYLRYPLRLYYMLNEKENFLRWGKGAKLQSCLFLGADIVIPPSGGYNQLITEGGFSFYQGNGKYITATNAYYQSDTRWAPMISGGFCFKLYKGSYNILNLDLYGCYGKGVLSYSIFTITDINGAVYKHYETSTGSGIFLSISREFNLSSYREMRKDMQERHFLKLKKEQERRNAGTGN